VIGDSSLHRWRDAERLMQYRTPSVLFSWAGAYWICEIDHYPLPSTFDAHTSPPEPTGLSWKNGAYKLDD
jgi:hypothetical protein